MALNAKKIESSSNFKEQPPLEPGAYPARVVQILSLGLQPQRPYQGEEKPPKDELYVTYELLDEFMEDEDGEEISDKPRWISERFPLNNPESDLAKSTKRYLSLDPEIKYDWDWSQLAGTPCMVTIVNYKVKSGKNEGKLRDKVASVSSMRPKEAAKAKELVNPPKIFDIDDPDMEVFKSLPSWLQDVMTKDNLTFSGSVLEKTLNNSPAIEKGEDKEDKVEDNDEGDNDEEDW